MKLVQANIWGGRLEKPVINFFEQENADILCLQEAINIKGGKSAMFAATEEIQTASQAKHTFFSAAFSLNYMKRRADFGNCIISKLPIADKNALFTGKKYIENFDWLEHEPDMRNFQHVVLKTSDKKLINILNHHGHHIENHKNGDSETMRQCGLIAEYIKKLDGPIILAGDFNLKPRSKSLEQINKLLDNLSIRFGLDTTRTLLTQKKEVCDYVFVNHHIKVGGFEASDKIISDHKALILNFELI